MCSRAHGLIVTLVVIASIGFFYHRYISYKNGEQTASLVVAPKTILAFLGAPGSGKGTLAKRAVSQLDFTSVSTGDLCREEVASGSKKGKMIATYMQGGLIPDDVMTDMVGGWLSKNAGRAPVILDGYPRTKNQAKKLAQLLKEKWADYTFGVVYLFVSDEEEEVQRIADRLVCEKCKTIYSRTQLKQAEDACQKCGGKLVRREDDKEEIVRKRLKTFAKNNDEIIAYYKSVGIPVNRITVSHSTPEQIFENFKNMLPAYAEKTLSSTQQKEVVVPA